MRESRKRNSMRRILLGTTAAAIGAVGLMMPMQGTAQTATVAPVAWTQPANLADLIEVVSPAVVKITATHSGKSAENIPQNMLPDNLPEGQMGELFKRFFDEQQGGPKQFRNTQPMQALGSGFVVDEDGIIVTNNHVVEGADKLSVTLKDGREFEATLLGTDPKTDLAVLKIDADGKLPTVGWGNSDKLRVGDPVFAVGAPFGLTGSVTSGIVSARGRDIGAGPYDDFIQVDAPINKGNSGGPLFDAQGNVVGVNTAIYSPTGGSVGIGFSIPAELAKSIVSDIVANGQVERGWLGVSIQNVTNDIAQSLGLDKTKGVIVDSVQDNSPAKEAGVKSGDVIIGFGDTEIGDVGDLTLAVADAEIGKNTEMKVYRGGKTVVLEPKIAKLKTDVVANIPQAQTQEMNFGALGLALQSEGDSVVITSVDPDSGAAEAGLREGDIVVSVNQKLISSLPDIDSAVEQAKEAGRPSVLAQIERDGNRRFVAIPFSEKG
ncbi:Do family serine endopeptidase [Profundibacter sp.]|uniref:Do family serine endopeptidase n=1 Tax=Profundibacter sp. TaxID=3101071 RepID=UPI003D12A363